MRLTLDRNDKAGLSWLPPVSSFSLFDRVNRLLKKKGPNPSSFPHARVSERPICPAFKMLHRGVKHLVDRNPEMFNNGKSRLHEAPSSFCSMTSTALLNWPIAVNFSASRTQRSKA